MQPKPDLAPVAPITHPLFGVDQNNQQGAQQNGYGQDPQQQAYGMQNPMQPYAMQATSQAGALPTMAQSNFVHQAFPSQVQFQPNFQQQQQAGVGSPPPAQVAPPPAEPPKQKAPLPEEFIYLQTVFEELRRMCINVSNNPVRFFLIFKYFLSKKLYQKF